MAVGPADCGVGVGVGGTPGTVGTVGTVGVGVAPATLVAVGTAAGMYVTKADDVLTAARPLLWKNSV